MSSDASTAPEWFQKTKLSSVSRPDSLSMVHPEEILKTTTLTTNPLSISQRSTWSFTTASLAVSTLVLSVSDLPLPVLVERERDIRDILPSWETLRTLKLLLALLQSPLPTPTSSRNSFPVETETELREDHRETEHYSFNRTKSLNEQSSSHNLPNLSCRVWVD